jgi:transposase
VPTTSIIDTKIQSVISPRKRGPYRQHSTEFKRAIVAKSFVEGTSRARLAREVSINANQVFTWRRQFADLHGTVNEGPAAALLPVTVLDLPAAGDKLVLPTPGVIVLTVGATQLRLEGSVDSATLAQVLARLFP